jgi:hypothetical protein
VYLPTRRLHVPEAPLLEAPRSVAEPGSAMELEALPLSATITQDLARRARVGFSARQLFFSLFLGTALITGVVLLARGTTRSRGVPADLQTNIASAEDVRILAGAAGEGYTDSLNRLWSGDRLFQNGVATDMPKPPVILGTRDQRLFEHRREGTFSYHIPLRPGVYEMRLYFAETVYGENSIAGGGETSRIFDLYANRRPLLPGFDILRDAGSLTRMSGFSKISHPIAMASCISISGRTRTRRLSMQSKSYLA